MSDITRKELAKAFDAFGNGIASVVHNNYPISSDLHQIVLSIATGCQYAAAALDEPPDTPNKPTVFEDMATAERLMREVIPYQVIFDAVSAALSPKSGSATVEISVAEFRKSLTTQVRGLIERNTPPERG